MSQGSQPFVNFSLDRTSTHNIESCSPTEMFMLGITDAKFYHPPLISVGKMVECHDDNHITCVLTEKETDNLGITLVGLI